MRSRSVCRRSGRRTLGVLVHASDGSVWPEADPHPSPLPVSGEGAGVVDSRGRGRARCLGRAGCGRWAGCVMGRWGPSPQPSPTGVGGGGRGGGLGGAGARAAPRGGGVWRLGWVAGGGVGSRSPALPQRGRGSEPESAGAGTGLPAVDEGAFLAGAGGGGLGGLEG